MPGIRFTVGSLNFVYDSDKGEINKRKHGLSFESAAYVFRDVLRLDFPDEEHSTLEEERWTTIGLVRDVLTVVYCERIENGKDYYRLISPRQATPAERNLYNDAVFGRT